MKNKSALNHPVLIALGTIASLYALSLFPLESYSVLGYNLKGVNFSLGQVRTAPRFPITFSSAPEPLSSTTASIADQAPAVQTLATGTLDGSATAQTFSASLMLSSAPASSPVSTLASHSTGTLPPPLIVDYGSSMQYYYQALGDYQVRDKGAGMIKIAYVGDSQIEGDVITKDLRSLLQGSFGGSGTGFMKIVAEDAGFRTDMRHTFSGNWTIEALNRVNGESDFWFGPVFISRKDSWVSYELTGKGASGNDCYLIYRGDGLRHRITIKANNGTEMMTGLDPAPGMHYFKVYSHGDSPLKRIRLTFLDGGVSAYGVSFQAGTGIYVDNYSLRGHTGLELAKVSYAIASQVRQASPYKLIILQFGVNVAYAQAGGFKLYERGISNVLGHIKGLFPESGILVVSTTDRCIMDREAVVSDPFVTELMQAQRRAAEKEGVAFFDLHRAMGGPGAMATWVKEGYAMKDYVHINRRGGKKIADLLSAALLNRGTM